MEFDAIIVGSGPNGIAAAIELARAGCSVTLFEAKDSLGGGMRSAELTLPGYLHDVCSAIHPLGMASPFFRTLPLAQHGLKWIQPDAPLAHVFSDGRIVMAERSISGTAQALGADATAYRKLLEKYTRHWEALVAMIMSPLQFPNHPLLLASFGLEAIRSARSVVSRYFKDEPARGLFAGMAAHSVLPLESRPTAAFGLLMTVLAHSVGWPMPKGGAQQITKALEQCLLSWGGLIKTGCVVDALRDLPPSRIVMCDLTPRQLLAIGGEKLTPSYRRKLGSYRYGPGVFKMDWALSAAIPWRNPECARAGTVHIGGTFEAIAAAESDVAKGRHPARPFVILAQPSLFDPTRAPAGKHIAWAYCHVPNGSTIDMTARIEEQIEAVAPGFKDCILARHTFNTAALEASNSNYVGGDISGGSHALSQLLSRPVASVSPYRTSAKGIYICSSSTPPGGGVHGMCGYNAARVALADLKRV